ncbi:MAG: BrnT family toxin [Bauldia sp.]|nr:BrnT family toxin [Bauldia sp.]
MKVTYDPAKRAWTLRHRGLDFDDAPTVFAGVVVQNLDVRADYGEDRYIAVGLLKGRMVVVVWTPRPDGDGPDTRRIISMRKANEREQEEYGPDLTV